MRRVKTNREKGVWNDRYAPFSLFVVMTVASRCRFLIDSARAEREVRAFLLLANLGLDREGAIAGPSVKLYLTFHVVFQRLIDGFKRKSHRATSG